MLIDDILEGWENINLFDNLVFNILEGTADDKNDIYKSIKEAVVVDATNVAEYYFNNGNPKEFRFDDIVNLAPPFENVWIEFKMSKDSHYQHLGRFGVALLYEKIDSGWGLACLIFSEMGYGYNGYVCWGAYITEIDSNGDITLNTMTMFPAFNNDIKKDLDGTRSAELDREITVNSFMIAGAAVSFMHCKNVKLTGNEIPPKLQKARQKRNKPPLVKHYTLEISPVKKILKEQGNIEKTGIKQALHICRGHFKDYRDGRGLFGKYQGLYWWEDQVRGSSENGMVIKDYKVNPN
jgi:hypothetical protein